MNNLNTIQPQTPNYPINSEVHMYHPTEMANALTPTSLFYSKYRHNRPNPTQRDFPLRLKISFLLDSGDLDCSKPNGNSYNKIG